MGPRLGRVEYSVGWVATREACNSFNGATLRTRGIPDKLDAIAAVIGALQWGHA